MVHILQGVRNALHELQAEDLLVELFFRNAGKQLDGQLTAHNPFRTVQRKASEAQTSLSSTAETYGLPITVQYKKRLNLTARCSSSIFCASVSLGNSGIACFEHELQAMRTFQQEGCTSYVCLQCRRSHLVRWQHRSSMSSPGNDPKAAMPKVRSAQQILPALASQDVVVQGVTAQRVSCPAIQPRSWPLWDIILRSSHMRH